MRRRVTRRQLLAATAMVGLSGCLGSSTDPERDTETATGPAASNYDLSVAHDAESWDGYAPDWTAPTTAPPELEAETLVTNLDIGWDLSFTANGDVFVTERTGRLLRYEDGEVVGVASPTDAIDAGSIEPGVDENTWWVEGGEGGTMGVAAHPNYPDVPLVYLYYTATVEDGIVNRLASVDIEAEEPASTTTTILETPADTIHNGGRIAFGPANYLWCVWVTAGCQSQQRTRARWWGPYSVSGPTVSPHPITPNAAGTPIRESTRLAIATPRGLAGSPTPARSQSSTDPVLMR